MDMNINVLYFTTSNTPTIIDAQAQRVRSICMLLKKCSITILSNCAYGTKKEENIGENHVEYRSYRALSCANIFSKLFSYIFSSHVIKRMLKNNIYNIIVFNDSTIYNIHLVKKYGKINNSQLIYDAVEWYSSSEFSFRKLSFSYLNNNYINSLLIDKSVKVISISNYFYEYFTHKNIRSIYLPVILNKDNYQYQIDEKLNNQINIIYAGHMGKKDKLLDFLTSYEELDISLKNRFIINIVGPSLSQLPSIIKNDKNVRVYGSLSNQQILKLYKFMDFSIIFRNPKERYAMAGFPTKLVESMMCGVPVICNLFSNIGDYLVDEENSIIVNYSKKDICNCFHRISQFSSNKLLFLKHNARIAAENYFDLYKYANAFSVFIEK